MDISFDKLKDKVKQVVSERLRQGWHTCYPGPYTWDAAFKVLPDVIARAVQDGVGPSKGRAHELEDQTIDACNAMLAEIEVEAHKVVDGWDIRNAGKLIELFPEALPKKYQKAKFDIDMDEDGEWKLFFKNSMKMGM